MVSPCSSAWVGRGLHKGAVVHRADGPAEFLSEGVSLPLLRSVQISSVRVSRGVHDPAESGNTARIAGFRTLSLSQPPQHSRTFVPREPAWRPGPSGSCWNGVGSTANSSGCPFCPGNRINPDEARSVEPLKRMNRVVHPPESTKWGKNGPDGDGAAGRTHDLDPWPRGAGGR